MNAAVLAVVFIGGFIFYGAIGTAVVRRLIHGHIAEGHNDVLVPLFLTAGVIYAGLVALQLVQSQFQWNQRTSLLATAVRARADRAL